MRCHAHVDNSAFKYFEDSEWHKQQIHAMARKSVARAATQKDIHTYPVVSSTNLMWIFKETNNTPKETFCSSGLYVDVNVDVDNLCNTWTLFQMRVISIGYLLQQRFRRSFICANVSCGRDSDFHRFVDIYPFWMRVRGAHMGTLACVCSLVCTVHLLRYVNW